MASQSPLKLLHSLHVFSMKSPSSPSSAAAATTTALITSSVKLKTLLHTFVFSHLIRFLAKAKSLLLHGLLQLLLLPTAATKKRKLFFGPSSRRLHYNWSSSHVMPVPSPGDGGGVVEAEWRLEEYLQWVEERKVENGGGGGGGEEKEVNEIDRLADMFIASCHEKFWLEKQESYRMFQEMMARSV